MGRGHRRDAGSQGELPDDRGPATEDCQALRHAAGRCRRYFRRPHCRDECHRAYRVRGRPRQEGQADAELPDEHGPQLRRSAARPGFDATYGQAQSRHARELEAGRGCNYPAIGVGRGSQTEVPRRLEGSAALSADCSPTEVDHATDVARCEPEAGARWLGVLLGEYDPSAWWAATRNQNSMVWLRSMAGG